MNKKAMLNHLLVMLSLLASTSCMATPLCTAGSFENPQAIRNEVNKNLLLDTTRAIPTVHTEGTLPGQGIFDQSIQAKKDWFLMRNLALLWQQEQRSEDLAALSSLLSAWGTTYQPSFNPIDETQLDNYIVAYSISRDALTEPVRNIAQAFIRRLGQGYLDRMQAPHLKLGDSSTWSNNWNSHRVKLVTLAAIALDDEAMWLRARTQFTTQLGRNLRNDGSTVDFWQRDAMHYVIYDLEPLTQAALAARLHNENWLLIKGDTGASLSDALDWLVPYALGEKKRENEFQHSTVAFDSTRKQAGVKGFSSSSWDTKQSSDLYAMAKLLDTKYAAISQKLNPVSPWIKACWHIHS